MDSLVAQGEVEGLAGIIWSTNKYLYGRLKDNPSLLEGNSLMQSFVSAHENMPLGQFYTIGKAIETFYQIDSATQVLLNANQHVIEANLAEIETIDEELAVLSPGPQYDSLLQQLQELTDLITQLTEENAGIYQGLHDARVQQADALLSINSAISTSEAYETNEKEFFDVYLRTIAKDNGQVTPTQLTTLENIASQCPAEGGRAVYWAIGLHGHLDGGLLEIQECGLGGRSDDSSNGKGIKQANSFTLYPNPSSGDCKLVYELGEDNEGKILVADQFGREVSAYKISNTSGQLILADYPSGFYFIHLVVNGQAIQTEKLVRL
ncbi:MAG: T9SS type A sorting domain-containing protein [Saprospiraceae bacterium]|nr:MAG: T9SS type A sorting domain-containing protein [Saprospiraceae bacterium]